MSASEESFLSLIRANPDDDGVRLTYADWLEENGRPQRAEFIRVQIELARLADDDPRREALADRQDELLAAHGDEWRSAFPHNAWPEHRRFRGGFLEEAVAVTPDEARAVLRCNAIFALRRMKCADAADPMERLLTDDDQRVVASAAISLHCVTGKKVKQLPAGYKDD